MWTKTTEKLPEPDKIVYTKILAIVFAIVSPLVTIWSLNLLFGLAIPVTFKTYLAVAWLQTIVYGQTVSNNR